MEPLYSAAPSSIDTDYAALEREADVLASKVLLIFFIAHKPRVE